MTDNIIPVFGGTVHAPGEVNESVIRVLEYNLEQAKAGNMDAVILVYCDSSGHSGHACPDDGMGIAILKSLSE